MGIKIEFSTFEYVAAHGAAPRGRGGWGFFVTSFTGTTESGACPVFFNHSQRIESVVWAVAPAAGSMTYVQARAWMKLAVESFCRAAGVRTGHVRVEVAS